MSFKYGALFDMDGVIVDNSDFHIKAFEVWSNEKGIPFDKEFFKAKLFGQQNADIFKALTGKEMSEDEVEKEGEYKESIYRRLYANSITPLNGLIDFLKDLKGEKFGLSIATSGPNENVELVTKGIGAAECFDAKTTANDTKKGKPNPEVFLLAAKKLGIPPERCVVFEDSPAGAKAAKNAGCALVGVSTTHSQLDEASFMIADFTAVTAKDIMDLIDDNLKNK
jgi:beta-phosphoglucomutase